MARGMEIERLGKVLRDLLSQSFDSVGQVAGRLLHYGTECTEAYEFAIENGLLGRQVGEILAVSLEKFLAKRLGRHGDEQALFMDHEQRM